MCFLFLTCDRTPISLELGLLMKLDLGVLGPLYSALRRLTDGIGFLSIVNEAIFDPMVFYIRYFESDDVDGSIVDLSDPFLPYDFATGWVHPLPQDDGRLYDKDDWYLEDLLTSDAYDPHPAINADFDHLCVACR